MNYCEQCHRPIRTTTAYLRCQIRDGNLVCAACCTINQREITTGRPIKGGRRYMDAQLHAHLLSHHDGH